MSGDKDDTWSPWKVPLEESNPEPITGLTSMTSDFFYFRVHAEFPRLCDLKLIQRDFPEYLCTSLLVSRWVF